MSLRPDPDILTPRSSACLRVLFARAWRGTGSRSRNTQQQRGFRVANIKSQIKRNKQNEKARQRNKAVKSSLKTAVRSFREAADAGETDKANDALRAAYVKLDKAASKGIIHKNQAANRKSALAKRLATLDQG